MAKFNGFTGDYSGLSSAEVKKGQDEYGKNLLIPEKKDGVLMKILKIFEEPMFLLLFGTALLYFLLGDPSEGVIMLFFVAFMAGINLFQEWKTDKTLQALKDLSSPQVRVIRNNEVQNIDSRELTHGDLMILEEGEKIPADGKLIEMFDFGVDESTLTGESEVVWKQLQVNAEEEGLHWRRDYCYAGTMVTSGTAIVQITAVGRHTEYGKIGQDIVSVPDRPTPLEKQTRKLVKITAVFGLILCVLVFLVTFEHTRQVIESILSGITLAMAMIPEEFPVILTVFLALGAWRLARKNSLIRRIPAVETLGAISVLCVDKTGTLTKNQMYVRDAFSWAKSSSQNLFYWAALGCEIEPYDPMEKAILRAAEENGLQRQRIFSYPLLFEYSFSSETKMMGHVWDIDGKPTVAAKGSPESILPLCGLNGEELGMLIAKQEEMARKGLRVIAVAKAVNNTIYEKLVDNRLELVGLIGLADPPREAVPSSIALCKGAGIRVIMITGDNGTTARAIAHEIGLSHDENVVTGQELDQMSDEELQERVKDTDIFARVVPRHKMRIVSALQKNGETVGMTGDGVNDAPALKQADIGIAMGKRGTGVAKEAADMVLLDDNFETIVDTVQDGRRVYDNIKKAIGYVIVIHIPIALTALLNPLLHLPLLLLPIHVVLLELIIDPTCSIVFERQPAERDLMMRKPRSPKDPLVTPGLFFKAVLQGLAIFAAAFGAYVYMLKNGASVETARTFVMSTIVVANLFLVYVNQSDVDFSLSSFFRSMGKGVLAVNLAIVIMIAMMIYLPVANQVSKMAPLGFTEILLVIGLAAAATFWWDIVKLIKRRRGYGQRNISKVGAYAEVVESAKTEVSSSKGH